jgi:arylsulfatase A-like enzyme
MTAGPNLLFIMSDDHASHAVLAYGSRINRTPHLDRIAQGGMRMDSMFCTNSICTPSRASILTGTYNHVNGVTTLATPPDNTRWTFPQALRAAGYRTALFGKWHLGHGPGHDPTGFDSARRPCAPRSHKLIAYYDDPMGHPGGSGPVQDPEWELYDLGADPLEVHNIIEEPGAAAIRAELFAELTRLRAVLGDEPHPAVARGPS